MALSSDPYEQKLYHMFQAHDVDSCGGLDREALFKLCVTLELKERGHLLVKCLLNEQKTRVTFKEFREGLLHILGGEEPEQSPSEQAHKLSPPPQKEPMTTTTTKTVPDSSDGQNNVSTGSPTVSSSIAAVSSPTVSSSSASPTDTSAVLTTGSIISNTTKHSLHLAYQQRQAANDGDWESKTVVNLVSGGSSSISAVPSSVKDSVPLPVVIPTTPIIIASDNENESSDREVSPKFIVGTKKYGRRSRPREDCNGLDTSSDISNSDNESVPQPQPGQPEPNPADPSGKNSSKVQRSASQSDIHGTKRRRPITGSRLKRCASLPTHRQRPELVNSKLNAKNVRDHLNMDEKIDKKIYFMKLTENLREIWDSLVGNGHGDLLNQSQLEVVCERVGLQKLAAKLAAKEVFAKLSLQPIEGISYDDFIALLQNDSDILPFSDSPTAGGEGGGVVVRLFDESDNFKAQELDRDSVEETVGFSMRMPNWTAEIGSLSTAIIIDMWESAGIAEPRNLLQELGFYGEEIQVAELVGALEDEHQRLGDANDTSIIVRASLALHKAEVSALRQAFVQLVEENKKLYADNKEVNQRALLLAQEVDERHNSLETSTRNKIRLLEQRHHETVKELTSQLVFEREQLFCANTLLEKRIAGLEVEEGKMKTELARLAEENEGLRAEQETMTRELTDMLEKNIKLNKDIAELEENNRNDLDLDGYGRKDDLEMLELIEKISLLQDENTDLRDKNDELSAEIETLNVELARFKLKRSTINRTSSLEVSPLVQETAGGAGGYVEEMASAARKRQGDSPSKARLSDESPRMGKVRKCSNDENESDSSGDWMALHSELGMRVDSAIMASGILQECATGGGKEEEIRQLKQKVAELEKKLGERKATSEAGAGESSSSSSSDLEKVRARCEELEASLEQMSKEYEACEDYWQAKVNEERQLFEDEQRMADEKFNEVLKKVAELQEQDVGGHSSSKSDEGRLSPIEEKDILEQQYLDLEGELQQSQLLLEEKSHEVEKLKGRIMELEQMPKYPSEALLATPPRIETPEMDSPASSPISYLWNQSTIQAPATRDYHNPNWPRPVKPVNVSSNEGAQRCEESVCSSKLTVSLSPIPPNAANEATQPDDSSEPGFSRTISPIQKPTAATSTTDISCCRGENQDLVDCSDACSVKSTRSTHSLASTHSIHKSVSQTDVAMIGQEQLKQLRLMQLQLQDEIQELTQQRDGLKIEFQLLNEAKPIVARAKTAHPNLMQKINHLEQKNRNLQSMLKHQQMYTEHILHQIWQQQRSEISDLRNRLEAQSMVITDQANRLASNDVLVKDLYVENSHLLADLQQQKMRALQLTQAAMSSHHQAHHEFVPTMP